MHVMLQLQIYLHGSFAEDHKILIWWDGHPIGEVEVSNQDVGLLARGIEAHQPSMGPPFQKAPDVIFEAVLVRSVCEAYDPIFSNVNTIS